MTEPSNPLTQQFLARGKHCAEQHLRRQGHIPPTFFCATPDQEITLVLADLENEQARQFATLARVMCLAHEVIGAIFVAEVRVMESPLNRPVDTVPIESFRPREYALVSVEISELAVLQEFLPIVRRAGEGFSRLGEADASVPCRFPRFLPLNKPSEDRREMARLFLEVMGPSFSFVKVTRTQRR